MATVVTHRYDADGLNKLDTGLVGLLGMSRTNTTTTTRDFGTRRIHEPPGMFTGLYVEKEKVKSRRPSNKSYWHGRSYSLGYMPFRPREPVIEEIREPAPGEIVPEDKMRMLLSSASTPRAETLTMARWQALKRWEEEDGDEDYEGEERIREEEMEDVAFQCGLCPVPHSRQVVLHGEGRELRESEDCEAREDEDILRQETDHEPDDVEIKHPTVTVNQLRRSSCHDNLDLASPFQTRNPDLVVDNLSNVKEQPAIDNSAIANNHESTQDTSTAYVNTTDSAVSPSTIPLPQISKPQQPPLIQRQRLLQRTTSDPTPYRRRNLIPSPTSSLPSPFLPPATRKPSFPTRKPSFQLVKRRASIAASEVSVRTRSFGQTVLDGFVGLFVPKREDSVKRVRPTIVRRATVRWECIDSQYGSKETVLDRTEAVSEMFN
ncbi:hypothetical protein BT63DRAFT_449610 [Microthyrium microscopicum]|uniref:Uncharacterized protein n=1 Tax=Microthyrium microscopicum TaxID=703497 RepID=A0A6A6UT73_9PEZI|nr:hypothetical protein BT63DRAFT_449610 [Microthyrium microscopicum]